MKINNDDLPREEPQKPVKVCPDGVRDPYLEYVHTARMYADYARSLRDKPAGGFQPKPDWRAEYNAWAALPWWRRIFTAPPRMP